MDPLIATDRDFLMAEKIRLERENAKLRAALDSIEALLSRMDFATSFEVRGVIESTRN